MKKLVVLIALMGSLSGVRAATYIGDLTQTNTLALTNFATVVVQKSGTAGTGANGLWLLTTWSNVIHSLNLTNKTGITNIANGQITTFNTTNLENITNIAVSALTNYTVTNMVNITNIALGEIVSHKAATNTWSGLSNTWTGYTYFLGTNKFSDAADAVTITNIIYTTDVNTNRVTNTIVIWNGLIKTWTISAP